MGDKMTEKRIKELTNHSIHNTEITKSLTEEEFNLGFHYCMDWDGLFISPDSMEWTCCTCHPLKMTENKGA